MAVLPLVVPNPEQIAGYVGKAVPSDTAAGFLELLRQLGSRPGHGEAGALVADEGALAVAMGDGAAGRGFGVEEEPGGGERHESPGNPLAQEGIGFSAALQIICPAQLATPQPLAPDVEPVLQTLVEAAPPRTDAEAAVLTTAEGAPWAAAQTDPQRQPPLASDGLAAAPGMTGEAGQTLDWGCQQAAPPGGTTAGPGGVDGRSRAWRFEESRVDGMASQGRVLRGAAENLVGNPADAGAAVTEAASRTSVDGAAQFSGQEWGETPGLAKEIVSREEFASIRKGVSPKDGVSRMERVQIPPQAPPSSHMHKGAADELQGVFTGGHGFGTVNESRVTIDRLHEVVIQRASLQTRGEATVLRLHLEPRELGAVRVELSWEDGVLNARFQADRPDVVPLIQEGLARLEGALAERGVEVGLIRAEASNAWQASNGDALHGGEAAAYGGGAHHGRGYEEGPWQAQSVAQLRTRGQRHGAVGSSHASRTDSGMVNYLA